MRIRELLEDDDQNTGDLSTINDRQDAPAAGQAGANASPTYQGMGTASPNASEPRVNPTRTIPDANKNQVSQSNPQLVKGASRFSPSGPTGLPNQAKASQLPSGTSSTALPKDQYISLVDPKDPNKKPQYFKLGDLVSSITNQEKE